MEDIEKLTYRHYDNWLDSIEFNFDISEPGKLTHDIQILLIENDKIEADCLRSIIESFGCQLTRTSDYYHAINLIDLIAPPHLIILDMNLPYLSSYRLLEYIRNTFAWRKVPIIALYTSPDQDAGRRALTLGANDCLFKPFTKKILQNKMRSLLNLNSSVELGIAA